MLKWIVVLLLAGVVAAEPAFRYTGLKSVTIQNSGPSARKIDLVVVGDGYNASELKRGGAFEKDARAFLSELWRVSPFGDYQDRFNVHLVLVESHTSRRSLKPDDPDKYAFGSRLSDRNMVVLDRQDQVLTAARNAPAVDVIVTLSTLSGRATGGHKLGGVPMVLLTRDSTNNCAHEFGHSLGGLGDEYESGSFLEDRESSQMPAGDFKYPNLSRDGFIDPKRLRETAKWAHFLDLPDSQPLVSAYQGGFYRTVGVWRPSFRCVMRQTEGAPFCPVCHEEMVKAILKLCGENFDDAAYHRRHPLKAWK